MRNALALGTAQFGMVYGIANYSGRPDPQAVHDILVAAKGYGIEVLDTAIAYGASETVIGEAGLGLGGWQVITKLPNVPDGIQDIVGWMEIELSASMRRLGVTHLHGVLLHAPAQLRTERGPKIGEALATIVDRGLASRIGVSIQHPETDIPAVMAVMDPHLIQAPLNILDRSLLSTAYTKKLRASGCQVHSRSAFLQGLLVLPTAARPTWCSKFAPFWQEWDRWLEKVDLSPVEACLRFVRNCDQVDHVVIGVETLAQLRDMATQDTSPLQSFPVWPHDPPIDLITPSKWPN